MTDHAIDRFDDAISKAKVYGQWFIIVGVDPDNPEQLRTELLNKVASPESPFAVSRPIDRLNLAGCLSNLVASLIAGLGCQDPNHDHDAEI